MGYRPSATQPKPSRAPGQAVIPVRSPSDGTCPGCGLDDEPLREQPWAWSVPRWLCTWCAELNETAHQLGHDLRLPWALPDPGIRSRR